MTGSERAREGLVVAYSPLVKYVAGRMASGLPAHVDEADLISYGLVGLINAIERFDLGREVKFETYAITRIKGAIIDELRSLDWVPRSVRQRAATSSAPTPSSSTGCNAPPPTRRWRRSSGPASTSSRTRCCRSRTPRSPPWTSCGRSATPA